MLDLSEQSCRSMLESYYAARLNWEKQRALRHEKKAKTPEELAELQEKLNKKQDHSRRVFAACLDAADGLASAGGPVPIDRRLLFAAALLHDIAKFDSNKFHHRLAVSAVKTVCGPYGPEDSADFFALDEIITAHKTQRFAPCPEYAAEAAILRMADKLDQVYRKARKLREAERPGKKLAKKEASLEEAKADFMQNLQIIQAFSESEHHGSCDPAFYRALREALKPHYDSLLNR